MSDINWDEAPEGSDVALTTGPEWNAESNLKGCIEFAARNKGGYFKPYSVVRFIMGSDAWVVLGNRPSSAGSDKDDQKSTHSKSDKFSDGDKYIRTMYGLCGTAVKVDAYRVLDAYPTNDPAVDHAIKKMLCAGQRGHKYKITDYENAIESMQKALVLLQQKDLATKS